MCLQTILLLPKIWGRNEQSFETKWGETTSKKRPNIYSNYIFKKIVMKDPFKKDDVEQKQFLEDLGFLIVKNNLSLQFVKNVWLMHFNMH
jgi:hypothetical protein